MKYALYMIMCSAMAGECMHKMENKYNDMYSCLNAGYKDLAKSQEIGKQETNESHLPKNLFAKEEVIVPKPKPKVKA